MLFRGLFIAANPNRVISSLEGNFGTVSETFVQVLERLFIKIWNLCKNYFLKEYFSKSMLSKKIWLSI